MSEANHQADGSAANGATTASPSLSSSSSSTTSPASHTPPFTASTPASASDDFLSRQQPLAKAGSDISLDTPTFAPSSPAQPPPIPGSSLPPSPPPASSSSSSLPSRLLGVPDGLKVVVHFRAVGDAPILKKARFMLSAQHRFVVLIDFLRRHLHYRKEEQLFLFCNAAFSPSPDHLIYDLHAAFQLNNELVINYATQDAWG